MVPPCVYFPKRHGALPHAKIAHLQRILLARRRLLLAVLEDGIRTLLKHARATHGRGLNLRREALTWLTTGDRSDVFCFENICETLGVDAARLRARVLAESDGELPQRSLH